MIKSIHYSNIDPGISWIKEEHVSIDSNSNLDSQSVITPNAVELSNGKFRMFYTGLGPGRKNKKSKGYILSAISDDGINWEKEEGVRLDIEPSFVDHSLLSPDVIPLPNGKWRMYVEGKSKNEPAVILSAISKDLLNWKYEPGIRLSSSNWSFVSPKCVYLNEGSNNEIFRIYFHHYSFPFNSGLNSKNHIISAISRDGLNFKIEKGVRIKQENLNRESYSVYGAEIIRLEDNSYRMYYSGWSDKIRGGIFSAVSKDGLEWKKEKKIIMDLDRELDCLMLSEPCVTRISKNSFRMYYEAEDSNKKRRILSAVTKLRT